MVAHSKLTPETREKLLRALRLGSCIDTAAAAVGVRKATLLDWLREGARTDLGPLAEFSAAAHQAMADGELSLLAQILKAGASGQWQANAWLLERRYPQRYGRKARLDKVEKRRLLAEALLAEKRAAGTLAPEVVALLPDDPRWATLQREYLGTARQGSDGPVTSAPSEPCAKVPAEVEE